MRALLLLSLLLISPGANAAGGAEYVYEYEDEPREISPVPALNSFKQVAETARTRGVPILVEFSTPWCRYCEALEQHVLKPLLLDDRYSERIIVTKLEVNTYSSIDGFDGKRYRSDQLSRMYHVDLYPTLVFFDANGREISRRIVGITVLDYIADELERAIDAAVKEAATAL
jgi:thioredoxin-related protein